MLTAEPFQVAPHVAPFGGLQIEGRVGPPEVLEDRAEQECLPHDRDPRLRRRRAQA